MTRESVTDEYFAERPLPVALWLASVLGVIALLTTTFVVTVTQLRPAWPKEAGVVIGLVLVGLPTLFVFYSASMAARWVTIGAKQLGYPVPSKGGTYHRKMTYKEAHCVGATARWVWVRFGWGLPYAFPRHYRRKSRRYELTVQDRIAKMMPVNGA